MLSLVNSCARVAGSYLARPQTESQVRLMSCQIANSIPCQVARKVFDQEPFCQPGELSDTEIEAMEKSAKELKKFNEQLRIVIQEQQSQSDHLGS